jgi:hypothetical protein
VTEERDPPPCDDPAHFEVRKGNVGNGIEQDAFIGFRDEVVAIMQSRRQIVLEEMWRSGHNSVSHGSQPSAYGINEPGSEPHPAH